MPQPSDQSSGLLPKEADSSLQNVHSAHSVPDYSASWRTHFRAWAWEIASLCCGAAFLIINVAILSIIDGKPLNPWNLFGHAISPNTLISIFSTLSKTSITLPLAEGLSQLKWTYFRQRSQKLSDMQLFDEASRGPLGALKLAWQLNVRAVAAGLGAVTIALTVAMDPFSQQLPSYPTKRIFLNYAASASIAVTNELPNMTSSSRTSPLHHTAISDPCSDHCSPEQL